MDGENSAQRKTVSIKQAIEYGISRLTNLSESPKIDVEVLLCDVLKCNRTRLLTHDDQLLTEKQCTEYSLFLHERESGKPISYIIGHQGFWTLTLKVNESTLIPRPETELLIEEVLKLDVPGNAKCVDLGTGTGAIALAIAVEKPSWSVVGCDLISDAVNLATENKDLNKIENAHFLQSNWFSALQGQTFNIIVSNPPYVEPDSEYLSQGDVRFEPLSALTAEEQGMSDIRIIVNQASNYLEPGGWVLLEHGFEQGSAVRDCLNQNGFTEVKTFKDYADLDRVTIGKVCN